MQPTYRLRGAISLLRQTDWSASVLVFRPPTDGQFPVSSRRRSPLQDMTIRRETHTFQANPRRSVPSPANFSHGAKRTSRGLRLLSSLQPCSPEQPILRRETLQACGVPLMRSGPILHPKWYLIIGNKKPGWDDGGPFSLETKKAAVSFWVIDTGFREPGTADPAHFVPSSPRSRV